MAFEHTEQCLKDQESYETFLREFEAKYPNYCKRCNGWGGFYSQYDPSPAGVSLGVGWMTDFDTCPECVDNDKCPLCGEPLTGEWGDLSDPVRCTRTECEYTEHWEDGLPEPPECYCWEQQEDEWLIPPEPECSHCGDYDPEGTCPNCGLRLETPQE